MTRQQGRATMGQRGETVLVAALGVVGFVFVVLGGLLAGEFDDPTLSDARDPAAIVDFYQGATFDAAYVAGVILETFGFLMLMAFVVKVADIVRGGEAGSRWAGMVVVAAMVVATVLTIVSIVALGAGTFRASNGGLSGDGYVVLADIRGIAYWLSLPAWALVYVASGALIVQLRSYPLWLGWAALIIGLGHILVSFFDSVAVWDIATGLGGLWFLAIAMAMIARPTRYST